jgi:hypothetical protein
MAIVLPLERSLGQAEKSRRILQPHNVDLDCCGQDCTGIVETNLASRKSGRESKRFQRHFFLSIKLPSFLDNSRQNFFAHVRDGSHWRKITVRAIRIMTA